MSLANGPEWAETVGLSLTAASATTIVVTMPLVVLAEVLRRSAGRSPS